MRKATVFDRIVLRAIRRIMSHTNFSVDAIRQLLEMIFEHVPTGRVAAAAIAQQQKAGGVRIGSTAAAFPPAGEAVAGEATGVVAQAEIDVAKVSLGIVDAMRIKHSLGGTGKIVVKGLQRLLRVEASGAKQKAQEFFVFAVDAEDRVRRTLIRGSIVRDDAKLPITMDVPAQGQGFLSFTLPQTMAVEQLRHHRNADVQAALGEFCGNLGT